MVTMAAPGSISAGNDGAHDQAQLMRETQPAASGNIVISTPPSRPSKQHGFPGTGCSFSA